MNLTSSFAIIVLLFESHYMKQLYTTIVVRMLKLYNVHINIKSSIHTALSKDILPITCGAKVFEIPVSKLNIKKYQTYILYNKGISTINTQELFNASKKSNIYIHIELH